MYRYFPHLFALVITANEAQNSAWRVVQHTHTFDAIGYAIQAEIQFHIEFLTSEQKQRSGKIVKILMQL